MFAPIDIADFVKDEKELKKLEKYVNNSYYFTLFMFIIILFFSFLI